MTTCEVYSWRSAANCACHNDFSTLTELHSQQLCIEACQYCHAFSTLCSCASHYTQAALHKLHTHTSAHSAAVSTLGSTCVNLLHQSIKLVQYTSTNYKLPLYGIQTAKTTTYVFA
eukprot:6567-Heterococcus_DN1.PRE.2